LSRLKSRHSLKKREKRNISNAPKTKNTQNSSSSACLSLFRPKSRFREAFSKEKREKER